MILLQETGFKFPTIFSSTCACADVFSLSSKGVDAPGELSRLHRPRRRPHRLDQNADTAADISMVAFYEKEFRLDNLIQQYKENMKACLKKVKALSIVLQPPLSPNHNDADLKEFLGLFPKQAPDQAAFAAEFEVFVNVVNITEGNTETGERTFSKLKIVKTALRNSTSDDRLLNLKLILLNCEKDITDTIDLGCLVNKWSTKTKRRIDL